MKIIMINHMFLEKQFCKRWENLAQRHKDWDITLLAPAEFVFGVNTKNSFGVVETKKAFEFDRVNFHVKPVKIKTSKYFGWTSDEMIAYIREAKPDVVYHIGSHIQESLMQILNYKKRYDNSLKVYAFSMRGPQSDLSNISNLRREDRNVAKKILRTAFYYYQSSMIRKINKFCDAIFCHYPTGMECFRKEGYTGPIFMQTQVGVDIEVFHKDEKERKKIREKYNLGDAFVFASALRFVPAKGVLKVLDALPLDGNWKYLLMGSGIEENVKAVKDKIKERGIEDRVILPGFIEWKDMAAYWNAADCAIHFTQSTPRWVETFSLALVQAMATELPVIGSTSGSVPYQIGPDGWILDENDIIGLHNQMQYAMNHPQEAKVIGKKLCERTVRSFSTSHLNELFYHTVNELEVGNYNPSYVDMANSSVK